MNEWLHKYDYIIEAPIFNSQPRNLGHIWPSHLKLHIKHTFSHV